MRSVAIMGYGTAEDRQRVAALAKADDCSASEWIIKMIREQYTAKFGELPPGLTDHQE